MKRRARFIVFGHDERFSFWFDEEEAYDYVRTIGGYIESIPRISVREEKENKAQRVWEEGLCAEGGER